MVQLIDPEHIDIPDDWPQDLNRRLRSVVSAIQNLETTAIQPNSRAVWNRLTGGRSGRDIFSLSVYPLGSQIASYFFIAKDLRGARQATHSFLEKLRNGNVREVPQPLSNLPAWEDFRIEHHADGGSIHKYYALDDYVYHAVEGDQLRPSDFVKLIENLTLRLTDMEDPKPRIFGTYSSMAKLKERLLPDHLIYSEGLIPTIEDDLLMLAEKGITISPDYELRDHLRPDSKDSRNIICVRATILNVYESGEICHVLCETSKSKEQCIVAFRKTGESDCIRLKNGSSTRLAFQADAIQWTSDFLGKVLEPTSILTFGRIASEFERYPVPFLVVPRHGDLHQGNVLVNDKGACVIDWDSERFDMYYQDVARLEVSFWFNWSNQTEIHDSSVGRILSGDLFPLAQKFESWAAALRGLSKPPRNVRPELGSSDFESDARLSLLLQIGLFQRYWFNETLERGLSHPRPLFAQFARIVTDTYCRAPGVSESHGQPDRRSPPHAAPSEAELLKERFGRFSDIQNVLANLEPAVGTTYFRKLILDDMLRFAAKLFEVEYATALVKKEAQADELVVGSSVVVRPRAYMHTVSRFADCVENIVHPHGVVLSMNEGRGVVATAYRAASPILVPDVRIEERYVPCYYGIRSELVVPIFDIGADRGEGDVGSRDIFCMLNLESVRHAHFVPLADVAVATLVASHIQLAMHHVVLRLVSYEKLIDGFFSRRSITCGSIRTAAHADQLFCQSFLAELEEELRKLCHARSLRLALIAISGTAKENQIIDRDVSAALPDKFNVQGSPLAILLGQQQGTLFVPSEALRLTENLTRLLRNEKSSCAAWIELAADTPTPIGPRVFLQMEAVGGAVPLDVAGDGRNEDWREEAALLLAFYLIDHAIGGSVSDLLVEKLPAEISGYKRFIRRKRIEATASVERKRNEGINSMYRQRTLDYIAQRLASEEQTAVLEHVLPSIAFRECFPLRNVMVSDPSARLDHHRLAAYAGPLQPYHLPDSQPNIPRKTDPETAKWLATCLTDYSDPETPLAPVVLVLGDARSDLELAQNLAGKTFPALNVGCSIMSKSESPPRRMPTLRCDVSDNWATWEEATRALLTELSGSRSQVRVQRYIICDIDRTLILPQGHPESSAALRELRENAYSNVLRRFFGRDVSRDEASRLYEVSDVFPPYVTSTTRGDEDVRAIAAVLLGLELIEPDGWRHDPGGNPKLSDYLVAAINRARSKKLGAGTVNVILQLYERAMAGVPTIFEEFRECEHQAFLELQKNQKYFMNRRVLDCLKFGCENGWIPIGYSDRPGASVGLRVDAHHFTAWPVLPEALISLPAKLIVPN